MNGSIEAQFAEFQAVLGAVREIRSRQNIAMKEQLEFRVTCPEEVATRLEAMQPYFAKMANALASDLGPDVTAPRQPPVCRWPAIWSASKCTWT